jgi:hypothetical protein
LYGRNALLHVLSNFCDYGVVELPTGRDDTVAAAHYNKRHIELALIGGYRTWDIDIDGDVNLGAALPPSDIPRAHLHAKNKNKNKIVVPGLSGQSCSKGHTNDGR